MTENGDVFSLVGPGRVGTSLGMALIHGGWRCDSVVVGPGKRSERTRLKREFRGSRIIGAVSRLSPDFRLLLLTVPDSDIEATASRLARVRALDWHGKVVLHVSGVAAVDTLRELKEAGASTGAFHPVSPFATKFQPDSARHIYYDFLGDDSAEKLARAVARRLSSKMLPLGSERDRALLHIAGVIASNFTVVGLRAAERSISGIVPAKDASALLRGLLASTVRNVSSAGDMNALTGPLARGDAGVIAGHLQSLENDPLLLQFYRSSSLLGIDLLIKRERNATRRRNLLKIRKLLEE